MRKHVGMSRTDAKRTKNCTIMISVQGLLFMVVALCMILGVALGTAQADPTLGPNPPVPPAYSATITLGEGGGPGQVAHPTRVAVDAAGSIYVADHGLHRVQKRDAATGTWTVWGNTGVYGTNPGEFFFPQGVAVDSAGNVYVADTNNNRIQKRDVSSGTWTVWGSLVTGSTGTNPGEFNQPYGITVDREGNVYVADSGNNRIQKRDAVSGTWTTWGSLGSGLGEFGGPTGVAVDSAGNVYVSDAGHSRIQRRDVNGTWTEWGTYGTSPGEFNSAYDVALDSAGNVYVVDGGNNRIQRRDVNGVWSVWGSYGTLNNQFDQPEGVAVDSAGNVYVADRSNSRVQKFTQTNENIYKTIPDNTTLTFSQTDFTAVFSPTPTYSMLKVRIESLPSHGTLMLGSNPVSLNQEIPAASLGTLTYTPYPDYIGTDSFLWNAADEANYAPNQGAVGITITQVPQVSIGSPSVTIASVVTNVTYTITYINADTITLAPGDVTLNTTGGATGTVGVSGTGNITRTVSISNPQGNGTIGISIAAGTASNATGHTAAGAGPSAAFTVDTIHPNVESIGSIAPNSTNASPIPVTVTFTEDVFNFTSSGVSVTNGTVNMSSFSGSGATYSFNVTPTANGAVTVNIEAGVAQDAAGNLNTAAVQLLSRIYDTLAPDTSITSQPANPTNLTRASFSFSATEMNATFECQIDGGAYAPCTTPKTYSSLSGNTIHTFNVRAIDMARNADATPASYSWLIDTTALGMTINTTASNPTRNSPIPVTVIFSKPTTDFSDTEGDVTIVNGSITNGSFGGSGTTYTFSVMPSGDGLVTVNIAAGVAHDAAGNPNGVSSLSITYDATSPDTTITSQPANPTNLTSASFSFSATEMNATFECQIDGGAYAPCTTPKTYSSLSGNTIHTFNVRAIDTARNADATPASYSWLIDTHSGDLNGDGSVDMVDALKALRMAAGLDTPTQTDLDHGDVAPLVNGQRQPDGQIDIGDVVVILRKAVGLTSW